ncbi:N-acetyl-gamma-glutamyl-phosphate reductase [Psychromonas sp. psych-6C06]|uniref:N-acetyl-gamma-glutamyl-phosphate reductase n=1 Tax=Psychromonas sp. psych-6C06 TaxID=2058089 RepID=UPI000C31D7CE|nr:N-acetyl-gamma-glutamyl-phosphate reductase [Psychromonas sp. psych-6C06]PKF60906.1 N-acetyl-gamma-glutamyl-phosphate reductase [Psychromonas sp. psych-6C06]
MLKAIVVGASGYTGAELAQFLTRHPEIELAGLYVSEGSLDKGKKLSDLYGNLVGVVDLPLQPLGTAGIKTVCEGIDIVILATAHEVSHDLAPLFLAENTVVFDLSGAFRVQSAGFYDKFYGFTHQYPELLEQAVYGLAEWNDDAVKQTDLIAVPGCYTTASLTALKPLAEAGLIKAGTKPTINATSGVSGAGRKASVASSFCEVSLQPYGVFTHRHKPEIDQHLGLPVVFTPHLGSFKRGILASINVVLKEGVTAEQVNQAYQNAYADKPIVRLMEGSYPALKNVVGTPYCDLGWAVDGDDLVVFSAIDNLLKGASSQAIQCINLRFGFDITTSF